MELELADEGRIRALHAYWQPRTTVRRSTCWTRFATRTQARWQLEGLRRWRRGGCRPRRGSHTTVAPATRLQRKCQPRSAFRSERPFSPLANYFAVHSCLHLCRDPVSSSSGPSNCETADGKTRPIGQWLMCLVWRPLLGRRWIPVLGAKTAKMKTNQKK